MPPIKPEHREEMNRIKGEEVATRRDEVKLEFAKLDDKREQAEAFRAAQLTATKLSDDDIELGYSIVARDPRSSRFERLAALDSLRDMRGLKKKASDSDGADDVIKAMEQTLAKYSAVSESGSRPKSPSKRS